MSLHLSPSQALKLLLHMNIQCVRAGEPDLSFRQLSVLLHLYLTPPPFSVRELAQLLQVSKPVITRALDHLGGLNLITRRRNEKDKRMLVISRTIEGAAFLERLTQRLQEEAAQLKSPYARLSEFDFNESLNLEGLSRAS